MFPTDEQKAVLAERGNCVIVVAPGSGKTATITALIKNQLQRLPEHKGVVGISYTNRASAELRQRVRHGGTEIKSSFFGTIDKFFLSELIMPFGRHLWGVPRQDLIVSHLADVPITHSLGAHVDLSQPEHARAMVQELGRLYRHGHIVLDHVGLIGCAVFRNSLACRRYLKARYTDIVIDEYQDCDSWQHRLFLFLVSHGTRGVAVGDLDQSIFSFAHKYPQFLRSLVDDVRFSNHRLTINHRCHPSIECYASTFLNPGEPQDRHPDNRMYLADVHGSEREIGLWLNTAVPDIVRRFGIHPLNRIALLVRYNSTADRVMETLTIPCRRAISTELDKDNTAASGIFRTLLHWVLDPTETRRSFVEDYLDPYTSKITQRKVIHLLADLRSRVPFELDEIEVIIEAFSYIAAVATAGAVPKTAQRLLRRILYSGDWLHFQPAFSDQLQMMTIHKAKSLEFDAVVHLDLYKEVLPQTEAKSESEEANLHYVAITRARELCILCTSSVRHHFRNAVQAEPSPFLTRSDLLNLREQWSGAL